MSSPVAFKPIDPKRDEFRRYLEHSGVIEALTKVIICLVKKRPQNPLEYLRINLGEAKDEHDDIANMQKELEEARCEISRLRKIIESANPEALLEEQPKRIAVAKDFVAEKESDSALNEQDEAVVAKDDNQLMELRNEENKET